MTEKNLKEGGKLANVTLTWSHHQSPSGKHSNMTRCQIWGSFESHCGSKMNELVSVLVSGAFRRFQNVLHSPGVSGNSRSRPFPRMKASDSLSRIMGMDFFIPFPFPNFGNAFFSFPSRSRIMGMGFFHSLPVPELWEWIFFIPFPFPNCGNGFF